MTGLFNSLFLLFFLPLKWFPCFLLHESFSFSICLSSHFFRFLDFFVWFFVSTSNFASLFSPTFWRIGVFSFRLKTATKNPFVLSTSGLALRHDEPERKVDQFRWWYKNTHQLLWRCKRHVSRAGSPFSNKMSKQASTSWSWVKIYILRCIPDCLCFIKWSMSAKFNWSSDIWLSSARLNIIASKCLSTNFTVLLQPSSDLSYSDGSWA